MNFRTRTQDPTLRRRTGGATAEPPQPRLFLCVCEGNTISNLRPHRQSEAPTYEKTPAHAAAHYEAPNTHKNTNENTSTETEETIHTINNNA
jgi:hypothetical protein